MVHTVDIPTFVFIWAIQIKGRDSALNSAYLSFSIDTSDYLLIVRREPGGTEVVLLHPKYAGFSR